MLSFMKHLYLSTDRYEAEFLIEGVSTNSRQDLCDRPYFEGADDVGVDDGLQLMEEFGLEFNPMSVVRFNDRITQRGLSLIISSLVCVGLFVALRSRDGVENFCPGDIERRNALVRVGVQKAVPHIVYVLGYSNGLDGVLGG